MFMHYESGHRPIDLEAVLIDGQLGFKMDRDEVARRLSAKGLKIAPGSGRNSMLLQWARHLELDHSVRVITP
jgi:hypothetical protein